MIRAAIGILAGIAASCVPAFADAGEGAQFPLIGCWTQTSPYRIEDTPAGKEWGERTWCFRRNGVLSTWNFACAGPAHNSCDGWDGQFAYRRRGLVLELQDYHYDDGGAQTEVWYECRIAVSGPAAFTLLDCRQSAEPWVRTVDPSE
jgi:hypothetical protein